MCVLERGSESSRAAGRPPAGCALREYGDNDNEKMLPMEYRERGRERAHDADPLCHIIFICVFTVFPPHVDTCTECGTMP